MRIYFAEFAKPGPAYHYMVGEYIRAQSRNDETVFMNGWAHPQTVFYAKRNIQTVSDITEAKKWLQRNKRKKGILFIGQESDGVGPKPMAKILEHVRFSIHESPRTSDD
jgi:hypothetical protein